MHYPTDFTEDLRNKPICGVLSCAVISRKSFAEAEAAIKASLQPWQKRHGGATYHEQRMEALDKLGVKYIEHTPTKQNLRSWVHREARPGVTYQVMTSRHVVTVRDRIAIDQYEIADIEEFNARRCFVKQVLEIVE